MVFIALTATLVWISFSKWVVCNKNISSYQPLAYMCWLVDEKK
jgi:hypothetical protein